MVCPIIAPASVSEYLKNRAQADSGPLLMRNLPGLTLPSDFTASDHASSI
jgi:hypothetical protein